MGKQKRTLKEQFRKKADSITIANKKIPWVARQLKRNPIGIDNGDGTKSSHVLSAEVDKNGNWFVFPTLDHDGKSWKDMRVGEGEYPQKAFDYARKNNTAINFGKDKDLAIGYSQNGLIDHTKNQDMKKPRRKLAKYAMGTGNTGVVKGYMPNPSEVFRQNQIDLNQAKYEAASNPFVQGLELLGGVATQAGLSMASKGLEEDADVDVEAPESKEIVTGAMAQIAKDRNINPKTGKKSNANPNFRRSYGRVFLVKEKLLKEHLWQVKVQKSY